MSPSSADEDDALWRAPSATRVRRGPDAQLWILTKEGELWAADLRSRGELGWELRLSRNGQLRYGHAHVLHAQAIAEGHVWRRKFEQKGWKPSVRKGQG